MSTQSDQLTTVVDTIVTNYTTLHDEIGVLVAAQNGGDAAAVAASIAKLSALGDTVKGDVSLAAATAAATPGATG